MNVSVCGVDFLCIIKQKNKLEPPTYTALYVIKVRLFCLGPPPPTNVIILSSNSNSLVINWDPHCSTLENCSNYGASRVPLLYTILYRTAADTGNGIKVTNGEQTQFPPTSITLTGLNSNTEYEISVLTTTTVRSDGKTVNSDFSSLQSGITGDLFFLLFLLPNLKKCFESSIKPIH